MLRTKNRLPPLDPLIAFEAAARHSSFALAARELNVTAPAVSQHIKVLEGQLGISLFDRGHRSVALTERGKAFRNSVSVALMHLANAADEVRAVDTDHQVTIATDTSVARLWLGPRLHRFEALYPQASIRLYVSDVQPDLLGSEFHLGIIHGRGDWRGHDSQLLFAEEVFPVCAPEFLARHGGTLSLTDLPGARLLDLEYDQWHWMNWAIWLTEQGLPLPQGPRAMRTNDYPVLIEAAKHGSGLALGWRHFVDDDLACGALVRPLQDTVTTANGYHLVWPFNADLPPMAAAFRDWATAEFAEPQTSTSNNIKTDKEFPNAFK